MLHGHVRSAVANGQARRVGNLSAVQRMNVSIVLKPRDQDGLISALIQLYDPNSPEYHKFLSVAQFTDQFAPSAKDYQTVVDFARAHSLTVSSTPANRLVVPVTGAVADIENAFHVQMGLYQHPTEARTFFSPDREPSLDLSVPVAHIAGLNNYSIPKPMLTRSTATQGVRAAPATGSGPGGTYLGSDMRAAYYGGTTLTGAGQTVGLVEFDGYSQSDVDLTFSNAGQSYTVPINNVLVDGATGAACQFNPLNCSDAEQVLDIAQAIGMAPGLSQVQVYIGNDDVDILNAVASQDLAQEVSISWTWLPEDPYTDDIFFQEMAAQGQSVFAASGDGGEFDPWDNHFYPAEDAWVVSVGGTDLTTSGAGQAWSSEVAWSESGGGVSPDGIALPSWQTGVANQANGGSTTLRNVPDVAMEANFDNYVCDMGACSEDYGGTSFATPRWAAFMALVNEQSATAGDPPVGFVDPALYAIGQSSSYNSDFHDITSGNNDDVGGCCGVPFYNAVTGYDLVTGWGSPAGQNLINALAPVAAPGFQLSSTVKSLTISPNGTGITTIAVAYEGGFAGSVELSVAGLPSGVTASWTSNPTSTDSVLTLAVDSTAVRGSYLLTITGTSGAVTASTGIALEVNAPGFSLTAASPTLYLRPGQSISTTVTVTDYAGFSGNVNLALASTLPAGVTATWAPDPTTSTSMLTLTASSSTVPNQRYMLTIAGSSGGLTATTTVALNIEISDFQLDISPLPANIVPGSSTTSTVTLIPIGSFTGSVTLSSIQLPPGVTATFNPVTTSSTSTLTMTASSSASLGASQVLLAGLGNCCAYGIGFEQTVTSSPTFNIGASSSGLSITPGGTATDTIAVSPLGGFSGAVNLFAAACCGITGSFSANPTNGSSVLTFSAPQNVPVGGPYLVFVTGTSGNQSSQLQLYLTVNPPPAFTLSASAPSVSLYQGSSATSTITVTPQTGFTGSVSLAATSPLPNGVTAAFSPNPTTGSSVVTFASSSSTPPGSYPVTIAGTANGKTVTASLTLNIAEPVATSTVLTISPTGSLTAGSSYTLTATVTPLSGTAFPTGNVIFTIGSTTQAVALNASGIATYTGTAPATPGPLSVSAAYQGSTEFSASTSNTLNQTIAAMGTLTNLSSSVAQISEGGSVVLTATVTPASGSATPEGPVQFYDGTVLMGTSTLTAGVAVLTTSGLPVGSDSLTASYLGGGGFAASNSASITVTVNNPLNPAPVVTGLSPAFTSMGGGGFTLTVNGSGFTTGSIAYWGTASLATQLVSGTQLTAQVPAADLATAGITAITVQTPSPGGGTSNTFQFEIDSAGSGVTPPDFTTGTASVSSGAAATYPVTFPATTTNISAACINLPAGASCSYSATGNTLTIATTSSTPAGLYQITVTFTETVPGTASAFVLLPLVLLPLAFVNKRTAGGGAWQAACLGLVLMAGAAFISGCAEGTNNSSSTSTNPTHQVTSSGTVSLTVQ